MTWKSWQEAKNKQGWEANLKELQAQIDLLQDQLIHLDILRKDMTKQLTELKALQRLVKAKMSDGEE